MLSTLDATSRAQWTADPSVQHAIDADHLCRSLVEVIHEAMTSRDITVPDLARHLRADEESVRAAIVDPLGQPLATLQPLLSTLGLTLAPARIA